MLRKGRGGLDRAQAMEERRQREDTRERDQIKFIDLRFERWQVVGLCCLLCGQARLEHLKALKKGNISKVKTDCQETGTSHL